MPLIILFFSVYSVQGMGRGILVAILTTMSCFILSKGVETGVSSQPLDDAIGIVVAVARRTGTGMRNLSSPPVL